MRLAVLLPMYGVICGGVNPYGLLDRVTVGVLGFCLTLNWQLLLNLNLLIWMVVYTDIDIRCTDIEINNLAYRLITVYAPNIPYDRCFLGIYII